MVKESQKYESFFKTLNQFSLFWSSTPHHPYSQMYLVLPIPEPLGNCDVSQAGSWLPYCPLQIVYPSLLSPLPSSFQHFVHVVYSPILPILVDLDLNKRRSLDILEVLLERRKVHAYVQLSLFPQVSDALFYQNSQCSKIQFTFCHLNSGLNKISKVTGHFLHSVILLFHPYTVILFIICFGLSRVLVFPLRQGSYLKIF